MEAISLNAILQQEENAIAKLRQHASILGFAFVQLPSDIVELNQKVVPQIINFFGKDKNYKVWIFLIYLWSICKEKFALQRSLGYQSVDHKESIRYLTADKFENKLPPGIIVFYLSE